MAIEEDESKELIEERDELRRENERLRERLRTRGWYEAVAGELIPEDYLPKW